MWYFHYLGWKPTFLEHTFFISMLPTNNFFQNVHYLHFIIFLYMAESCLPLGSNQSFATICLMPKFAYGYSIFFYYAIIEQYSLSFKKIASTFVWARILYTKKYSPTSLVMLVFIVLISTEDQWITNIQSGSILFKI